MERGRDILALVAPGLVWAVHFVLIYALISAACAQRALIGMGTVWIAGLILTVLGVVLALWPLRLSNAESVRRALLWSSGIFAAAIVADGAFVLLFQTCGG
ncbi:hypothetical protein [Histidinibacterium lentulum]|uniref:Uncharacterized protein n=1 Tax=Histidinibacterium lentulum TaxID=2480588 RepID=A0A3N2R8N5_9RHOB|nr:hypothetical protein [Histidinibacterium lentulum]ROU03773.1 hypothetical protein EAT49_05625 [Histidinibacterium lentulum]